jgi:hypothetical protein
MEIVRKGSLFSMFSRIRLCRVVYRPENYFFQPNGIVGFWWSEFVFLVTLSELIVNE